ncbi:MAG: ABC transporter permease subunit [Armatimonadetes bacterium]|nr:ABC transporter permease subunit [Armatimonadota bacterium]
MNWALIVFKKEWREMLRDRRVRKAMIFGPIISVVAMMSLFGLIFSSVDKATKTTVYVVEHKPDQAVKAFEDALTAAGMKIEPVASVAAAKAGIEKGDIRLALDFGDGMEATLSKPEPYVFNAYFDPQEQKAQIALSAVDQVAAKAGEISLKFILKSKGIDEAFVKPLSVKRNEVKVGESSSSEFIVQLLPYFVVIWAFFGALSSASDLVSGEKERQTLETLLISPAPRNQIAIGKLLALIAASLTATTVALGSIFVMATMKMKFLEKLFENGLGLTPAGFVVVVITVLPTCAFFGSLLLAISSFAKNSREAQTYLSQASAFVTLPAAFSQFIGLTDFAQSKLVYAIPILNTANVVRNALMGKYDAAGIAITIVSGVILASIAVWYSVRLFNRESILSRI